MITESPVWLMYDVLSRRQVDLEDLTARLMESGLFEKYTQGDENRYFPLKQTEFVFFFNMYGSYDSFVWYRENGGGKRYLTEEILEQVPAEIQEGLIFHLDLFRNA